MSGKDRIDCPTCRFTWKEFDGVPPCDTCRPKENDLNMEIIDIYCQCSGSMGISPMESMKLKGIKDIEGCLNKIQLVAAKIEEIRRKK